VDEVCGQKLHYNYTKSVLLILMIGLVLRELCPVSLTDLWRRNRGLKVVPATCKGFLEMFTQIQSLSELVVIHKLACSYYFER